MKTTDGTITEKDHGTNAERGQVPSSGHTATQEAVQELTAKVPKEVAIAAPGSALRTFFGRITPDAVPGNNTLTITGLPAGTRVASAWMTEFALPNNPHAGGAFFSTNGVQLYDNGTKCRVRFNLQWGSHLPAAVQFIYGPG